MTPERPQPGRIPVLPRASPQRFSPVVAKNLEEELFADIAHMVKSDIGSETRSPRLPPTILGARTPESRGGATRDMLRRVWARMPSGQPPPKGSSPPQASGAVDADDVGEEVLHEVASQLSTQGGVMSWIKDREQELGSARRGLPVLHE